MDFITPNKSKKSPEMLQNFLKMLEDAQVGRMTYELSSRRMLIPSISDFNQKNPSLVDLYEKINLTILEGTGTGSPIYYYGVGLEELSRDSDILAGFLYGIFSLVIFDTNVKFDKITMESADKTWELSLIWKESEKYPIIFVMNFPKSLLKKHSKAEIEKKINILYKSIQF